MVKNSFIHIAWESERDKHREHYEQDRKTWKPEKRLPSSIWLKLCCYSFELYCCLLFVCHFVTLIFVLFCFSLFVDNHFIIFFFFEKWNKNQESHNKRHIWKGVLSSNFFFFYSNSNSVKKFRNSKQKKLKI